MASTDPSSQKKDKDPTFRNYDAASAQKYLQHRPGYSDNIIYLVISQHTSSGGGLNLVLDVGCGPGNATRSLAPHFEHAIGADPGQSMIEAARTVPSTTKSGDPVNYEVCAAEALSGLKALKQFSDDGLNSVDLITAATAAHWFEMPRFWGEAAKILKPGGSVIIWGFGGYYCNPNNTPNAAKMQDFLKSFEEETLAPYEQPGNKLCRELYINLGLPWECINQLGDGGQDLKSFLTEFDQQEFVRLEFNKDGYVPLGESFFGGIKRENFDVIRAMLGTASPVTRWREAHKEKLERGEVEDVIDMMIRRIKKILAEVPEGEDRNWVEGGSAMVLLVVKKKR
jgi:trans-aconitate 3-methyltransferase